MTTPLPLAALSPHPRNVRRAEAEQGDDYRAFLASKAITAQTTGKEVDPAAINPMLFPFQRDLVWWGVRKGRAAFFTDCGCVAGETIIEGPDESERIDILTRRGLPIRVWSLTPDGATVATQASAPFKKGRAQLYRVTMRSGRSITVTGHHRFLTMEGWQHASSLHVGSLLAVSSQSIQQSADDHHAGSQPDGFSRAFQETSVARAGLSASRSSFDESRPMLADAVRSPRQSGYALSLNPSNKERDPSRYRVSDRYCANRDADWRYRYSTSPHQYDERLPTEEEVDRAMPPSQDDAHERTHAWSHWDDLAHKSEYSHRHLPGDLPSMPGWLLLARNADRDAEFLHASSLPKSRCEILPDDRQSSASSNQPGLRCESHQHQLVSEAVRSVPFACPFDTVVAINYIRMDDYYDLHVPFYENYLANGIWNHNTGKTGMAAEWARLLGERTLIVAPLAVAQQTVREGAKFGVLIQYARHQSEATERIVVTNYEMIDHFTAADFGAVVLDESGILKAWTGKTRTHLIEMFAQTPYRLCCTATPAPNDIAEIANHAEFLGIMTRVEMLATYFVHDSDGWRLKGHAREPFYRWLASWSMAIRKPSDLGYDDGAFTLPPLSIESRIVQSDYSPPDQLFFTGLKGIGDRSKVRRSTVAARVALTADLVNETTDAQWVVWCGLNDEQDALARLIPDCVSVQGSDALDDKISRLERFLAGDARVLLSKPTVAGYGLNLQCASRMAFVGLGDSYEQYYQSIRRCWRFGQTAPVTAYIVLSDAEEAVYANVLRKEQDADTIMRELIRNVAEFEKAEIGRGRMDHAEYREDEATGEGWTIKLGDSAERLKELPESSVDLQIYSPPFAQLFTYSASDRDLGNGRDYAEFFAHFTFITRELRRVLKPGRIACVHCQQLASHLATDGEIGMKDFRGDLIRHFVGENWTYHGEVCIDKNPQAQAIRTHSKGLLFKQFRIDSSWSRPAFADYILLFRKPGENAVPVHPDLTNDEWITYAHPVWYDIRESDTLNVAEAREDRDERHIAPLQLGTIERCINLWSNKGELVLDPFSGLGSSGYEAVQLGRRFWGCELKPSYYASAVKNLRRAESLARGGDLFSHAGLTVDGSPPSDPPPPRAFIPLAEVTPEQLREPGVIVNTTNGSIRRPTLREMNAP